MLTEPCGVRFSLKSYACFQNLTSAQREFNLKFQTKIARHEVQLPLYYTHFENTVFFVDINIYLSTSLGVNMQQKNNNNNNNNKE